MNRLALIAVIALFASPAQANPGCGTFACVKAAPIISHPYVAKQAAFSYAPVYYQVGHQVQQAAAEEHAFRRSPSQDRLLQLEGFYEGVMAVRETTLAQAGVQPGQEFAASPQQKYPVFAAKCMSCHNAPDSEGGLLLDPTADINRDGDAVRSILERAYLGEMPPERPLTPAEYAALETELLGPADDPATATPPAPATPAPPST